jgi:hypothetical protein
VLARAAQCRDASRLDQRVATTELSSFTFAAQHVNGLFNGACRASVGSTVATSLNAWTQLFMVHLYSSNPKRSPKRTLLEFWGCKVRCIFSFFCFHT